MKGRSFLLIVLIIGLFILIGGGAFRQIEQSFVLDSLRIRKQFDSSPVLSAVESMKTMQLEEGFEIKLVASEPLVNSPVASVIEMEMV